MKILLKHSKEQIVPLTVKFSQRTRKKKDIITYESYITRILKLNKNSLRQMEKKIRSIHENTFKNINFLYGKVDFIFLNVITST